MKRFLSKMLCILLCTAILFSIMPAIQVSAADIPETGIPADIKHSMDEARAHYEAARNYNTVSPASIVEDGHIVYFETFADLKQLLSRTYSAGTCAVFDGDAPTFIIEENLTVPENIAVYFLRTSVTIPTGVTYTSHETSFDTLIVNGKFVNKGKFFINENLTVNGSVQSSQNIYLPYGITLVGADHITFTTSGQSIVWWCHPSTATEFKTFLKIASQDTNGAKYEIYLWDIMTASDFDISDNTTVYVDSGLTVEGSCTVNGNLMIQGPTTVTGTLINNGLVSVYADASSKGTLTVPSTGNYFGSGNLSLRIDTSTGSTLDTVLYGLDLNDFEITSGSYGSEVYYHLRYTGKSLQLDAPTNLYADESGYLHWTNGNTVETNVRINIYCNGEQVYSALEQAPDANTTYCSESFIHGDWQNGTYYFEVTALAQNSEYRSSTVSKSAAWTYTRPSKKLGSCTNVKLNGSTVTWTAPSDTTYVGGYLVYIDYYASETISYPNHIEQMSFSGATLTSANIGKMLEKNDNRWISVAVQPLTNNVNKACSGGISEYTDRVYWSTAPLAVPAKPHKIVNVVSGVHVYWNTVKGASKYGVWRSETGKDGTYKWLANPTVPHFTDTTAVSGKTYYYKVTAMNYAGTHTEKSEAVGITFTSTPDISTRNNIAAGIKLGWQKISGATGYAIYRKSYSGTDAWIRIATIDGADTLTWTDTSVKNNNGEVFKYTIRALYGTTLSGCRNAGRTMVRLSSQVLTSATKASATSIKCSWTTSSRVTGYEVRFTAADGTVKTFTVGNYKTGVKTFTGLTAGETYTVQVRTYKKVDGVGSFYSDWSAAKTVKI